MRTSAGGQHQKKNAATIGNWLISWSYRDAARGSRVNTRLVRAQGGGGEEPPKKNGKRGGGGRARGRRMRKQKKQLTKQESFLASTFHRYHIFQQSPSTA